MGRMLELRMNQTDSDSWLEAVNNSLQINWWCCIFYVHGLFLIFYSRLLHSRSCELCVEWRAGGWRWRAGGWCCHFLGSAAPISCICCCVLIHSLQSSPSLFPAWRKNELKNLVIYQLVVSWRPNRFSSSWSSVFARCSALIWSNYLCRWLNERVTSDHHISSSHLGRVGVLIGRRGRLQINRKPAEPRK